MTLPNKRVASAYRSVSVDTLSPKHNQYELVTMMFDTLLACLSTAKAAMESGDVEQRVNKLQHAVRILHEGLLVSLDTENGGELAANLKRLYEYCMMRITLANATQDPAIVSEVFTLIKTVADGWKQMRGEQHGDATAGAPPAQAAGGPAYSANLQPETMAARPRTSTGLPRMQFA